VLDGFPAGFKVDFSYIQNQLDRRKPGQSSLTTQRKESDEFRINSGLFEGKTTGAPLNFVIKNTDAKPKDYSALKDVYRPSHADYTYEAKYGTRDYRGGGRSSARVTAGWVAAGALVQDLLEKQESIKISAYVKKIGKVETNTASRYYTKDEVDKSVVRCPDTKIAEQMIETVELAKREKDSLGGVMECVITGIRAGVGSPLFAKLNAALAQAMFSINAKRI